jgi:hypothetical protein
VGGEDKGREGRREGGRPAENGTTKRKKELEKTK